MKSIAWMLLLACLFGFDPEPAWAKWYPGIIHAHSMFSDGARTPKQLVTTTKQAGGRFLVVADHYEQINGLYQCDGKTLKYGVHLWAVERSFSVGAGETALGVVTEAGFDCYEFGRYRSRFLAQASFDFVVIPGAEITTFWGKGDSKAASHILALGDLAFKDDKLFDLQCKSKEEMQQKEEPQQKVIDRLNELGLLSVAAHPFLVSTTKYRYYVGDIQNLSFNPGQSKNINGIEFFNEGGLHDYHLTREWYLTLLRQSNDVFATSGCDSHVSVSGDSDYWLRKTWVFSEKLEAKSLLDAIAQGRTYAANYGASFEDLKLIPGFQAQEVDRAKFLFKVKFEDKVQSDKTVRIYRDGNLVTGSVETVLAHTINLLKGFSYAWEDKGVKGEHQYVIEVEGVLITSPIRLKIRTQPDILGKWVADDIRWAEIVTLQFERDGTVLMDMPFANIRIRDKGCSSGQWEISQDSRIIFSFAYPFPEQKSLKAEGQIDGDRIREFKVNNLGKGITFIKSPNAEAVKTTSKGKVWSEYVDAYPQYGITARLKIRMDKTILATISRIRRWKIESGGLIKTYDEGKDGNDIGLWPFEIKDNKLVDKICGSVYVRAKKGDD